MFTQTLAEAAGFYTAYCCLGTKLTFPLSTRYFLFFQVIRTVGCIIHVSSHFIEFSQLSLAAALRQFLTLQCTAIATGCISGDCGMVEGEIGRIKQNKTGAILVFPDLSVS